MNKAICYKGLLEFPYVTKCLLCYIQIYFIGAYRTIQICPRNRNYEIYIETVGAAPSIWLEDFHGVSAWTVTTVGIKGYNRPVRVVRLLLRQLMPGLLRLLLLWLLSVYPLPLQRIGACPQQYV